MPNSLIKEIAYWQNVTAVLMVIAFIEGVIILTMTGG